MSRRHELVILRNKKIVERFDYWFNEKRMRIDDVLNKLSREEFFLAVKTIEMILNEQGCYKPRQMKIDF